MYVNNLACVKIKWVESECFKIDSGVRHGCIVSSLAFQCIYGCSDERGENGEGEGE